MKKFMLMLGLILSLYTYSDGIEMLVGLHTSHNYELKDLEFNNDNKFMALKYRNIIVGRMINSLDRESYFVGYDYHISNKFSITTIIASGYIQEFTFEIDEYNEWIFSDYTVFGNGYKLIPMLNYRISTDLIISTNGVFNTINYIFEI